MHTDAGSVLDGRHRRRYPLRLSRSRVEMYLQSATLTFLELVREELSSCSSSKLFDYDDISVNRLHR